MSDLKLKTVDDWIAVAKGIPTQEELLEQLKKDTLVVTFNKLDGDERIMTCTKSFDIIPKEAQPKTDKATKEGNVTVWDTTAKGWRSFKYDRVTKVEEQKTN